MTFKEVETIDKEIAILELFDNYLSDISGFLGRIDVLIKIVLNDHFIYYSSESIKRDEASHLKYIDSYDNARVLLEMVNESIDNVVQIMDIVEQFKMEQIKCV